MAADYTVATAVSTSFPSFLTTVRGHDTDPGWWRDLPPVRDLQRRDIGESVTDQRTSFVRRLPTSRGPVFAKTYLYPTWAARLRAAWRWTGPWRASRAAREFDALVWMRHHDLPAPEPLAVLESRRSGFLCSATLLTAGFDGDATAALFPDLAATDRERLAIAIGRCVAALHDLGFRDRNLDLRNLLARRTADGFVVAKIDSPRHRLVRAGRFDDRFTAADWHRLLPQLHAFGVAAVARAAAAAAPLRLPPASADRRS